MRPGGSAESLQFQYLTHTMGLTNSNLTPRTFLSVGNGHFAKRVLNANGQPVLNAEGKPTLEFYNELSGILKSIGLRTATVKDRPAEFLDIVINDPAEGDYIISIDVTNRTAEDFVMALASATTFAGRIVSFHVYGKQMAGRDGQMKTFTNLSTKIDGEKLGWAVEPKDRPAAVEVIVNGQTIKDRTARIEFVKQYIAKVQQVLAADAAAPAAAPAEAYGDEFLNNEPEGDDLPM